MHRTLRTLCLVTTLTLLASCAVTTTQAKGLPPLPTVARVDLDRYVGQWYEIASFPQSFQRGCTHTTATYTKADAGLIEVVNRCEVEGKMRTAVGRARIPNADDPGKLEVSFFGPFWADYWIIDLDEGYRYAVVGHPSRDYLWILSRTPTLDAQTYDAIVARAAALGYDTSRLVVTKQ